MGCDIHLAVEVRAAAGEWRRVHRAPSGCEWTNHRNYAAFAILAGVRNYGDMVPIAKPRGEPADRDPATDEVIDPECLDYHNHSWLTLAELKAYDWDRVFTDRGYTLPAKEQAGAYYDVLIPQLEALGGAPEDVRIVFCFDN